MFSSVMPSNRYGMTLFLGPATKCVVKVRQLEKDTLLICFPG